MHHKVLYVYGKKIGIINHITPNTSSIVRRLKAIDEYNESRAYDKRSVGERVSEDEKRLMVDPEPSGGNQRT